MGFRGELDGIFAAAQAESVVQLSLFFFKICFR